MSQGSGVAFAFGRLRAQGRLGSGGRQYPKGQSSKQRMPRAGPLALSVTSVASDVESRTVH